MPALTKSEKRLEQLEDKQARESAKKKAESLQVKGFAAAAIIGFAEGYAEKLGFTFLSEGFGAVGFEAVQAGVGLYLARKKTGTMAEVGQTLATIGIYKFGRNAGDGFDFGSMFGG